MWSARVEELIKEIAEGTTLGRVLGSGAAVTGRVYGMRRVPTVKDQAMAVHERRGIKGMNVTYAKSPMGADHTAAATYRAQVDHHKPEGQMEVSRNVQVIMAFYDNFCCMFVSRGILKKPERFVNLINAVYGTSYGPDYVLTFGKEIVKLEEVFNIAAGVTQEYLPEFMRLEGLEPLGLFRIFPRAIMTVSGKKAFGGNFKKSRGHNSQTPKPILKKG